MEGELGEQKEDIWIEFFSSEFFNYVNYEPRFNGVFF